MAVFEKKRTPVTPESLLFKTLGVFYSLIKNKNVRHDINMLCDTLQQETDRRLVGQKSKPKRTSVGDEERCFVAIFKQKYLELVDLEYRLSVGGEELLMIKATIQKLKERGFNTESYIAWFFDVFLNDPNNRKYPPTIKRICSNYIVATFMLQHRGKIDEKRQDDLLENKDRRLKEHAKRLFRATKNIRVQQLLEQYNGGVLSAGDFDRRLREFEQEQVGRSDQDA